MTDVRAGQSALPLVLLLAVLMALVRGWRTLYSGSQNTYLLHALAGAGWGNLDNDWLASTRDPMPVFSAVARAAYGVSGPAAFWVLHLVAMVIGFGALLWWASRRLGPLRLIAAAGALALVVFDLTDRLTLQQMGLTGVADHSAIGRTLIGSAFGVFLLLAVALFAHGQLTWASVAASVAALMHPGYLVSGSLIVAGGIAAHRPGLRDSAKAVWPFVLVALPAGAWSLTFSGTEGATILVTERIPHHVLPSNWLSLDDLWRVAAILVAVCVYRREATGRVLGWAAAGTLAATLAVAASRSHQLMLTMPWRVTGVLVAVACVMLVTAVLRAVPPVAGGLPGAAALLAALWIGGTSQPAIGPAPRLEVPSGTYLVPLAWKDFRLASGQPIYIDFKSHPYDSREVVEWHERVKRAELFAEGECTELPGSVDWVAGPAPECSSLGTPRVIDGITLRPVRRP